MAFSKLEKFEAKVKARQQAELETLRLRELRATVKSVIPKAALAPKKRPRGRTPEGGVSRREMARLRAEAVRQLDGGAAGIAELEREIQINTLVILKLDGVLGTEPWRAAIGPHGAVLPANARLRYVDNAVRILADMRASRGETSDPQKRLMEGVIDAEVVK